MRGPRGPNRYAIMHTISYHEILYRDISAYRVYRTTLLARLLFLGLQC